MFTNSSPTPPVWLFDVDGTLTQPQGVITAEFSTWMQDFAQTRDVRIVSGGDRARILRQLGRPLVEALKVSYNSLGNSVWVQGVEISRLKFDPPQGLTELLREAPELREHVGGEQGQLGWKNGMLAFSLLGAKASTEQRAAYKATDAKSGMRRRLAQRIEAAFPTLTAQVAGETSVDIFPKGRDKSQVLARIPGPVFFFADATHQGGNDHTLSEMLRARGDGSRVYAVEDWTHTWAVLRRLVQAEVRVPADATAARVARPLMPTAPALGSPRIPAH